MCAKGVVCSPVSYKDNNQVLTPKLSRRHEGLVFVRNHYLLYLMLLLPMFYYFLFHYIPMYGIVIAFKDYSIFKGIGGSKWCGFANFEKVFAMPEFFRAIRNTLLLNSITLIFGFPAPIILALFLNELRNKTFKKTAQTILYLPHFLSWVIIGGMVSLCLQLHLD